MRSVRVDGNRSLELPDRGGHVVGVAVGASKKDMQGATISCDLLHLLEHCCGSNVIIQLLGLKQTHCQWVKVLDARLGMCDPREWLDSLCVVPVLGEGACKYSSCAQVVRIGSEDLDRKSTRLNSSHLGI